MWVSPDVERAAELAAVAATRTPALIDLVRGLDPTVLDGPSRLPGWSRLTVVCHLRYGAHALERLTRAALEGRPAAYYPEGRDAQRPGTLRPAENESPSDVVEDWATAVVALDAVWSGLGSDDWDRPVTEPADRTDLGTVPLGRLTLLRLTELDVHATDLDVGAPDWSPLFVDVALPTRLAWLATRRTNHRAFDPDLHGRWLLRPTGGAPWLLATDGDRVESHPAHPDERHDATIDASSRDLLALLLGRPTTGVVTRGGDPHVAAAFEQAFPGP